MVTAGIILLCIGFLLTSVSTITGFVSLILSFTVNNDEPLKTTMISLIAWCVGLAAGIGGFIMCGYAAAGQ
jgi:hypothetical protein